MMRRLLQFLALCAVVSLCVCYDSHESSESAEDLFVPRHRANSFIPSRVRPVNPPSRGTNPHYSHLMRVTMERRAEVCEDYFPCRFYASRHGSQQAFRRFFSSQTQPQRPAGIPRY